MKKLLLVLSLVILALLAAAAGFLLTSRDRESPEIVIDESVGINYQPNMTNEELLEGVTAQDDRDGDVTESLMVESVKVYQEEDYAVITYAAMDGSNNVAKAVRELPMEAGYDAEETSEEEPETQSQEIPASEEAVSEEAKENGQQQNAPVDENGQEERMAELSPEAPRLYLSQNQLTIQAGESFSALDWVSDIEDDSDDRDSLFQDIRVDGEVDTSTAGTYELTYYAVDSDGNHSNEEVLTVTVAAS
ncbi:MAG: immunoglobulin-like domain-containing protein [Ruminococcus sp.]|jgi:hypothetical protein